VTLVLNLLDDSCLGRERRVERLDVLFVSATALTPVNTTREGDRVVRIQVGSGVLDLTNQNVSRRVTKLKINMKKKKWEKYKIVPRNRLVLGQSSRIRVHALWQSTDRAV